MKIEIGRDWSEFLRLLISHHVRFVIVGGHAVAGHGEPRLTEDLDVLVDTALPNARRLRDALIEFGFPAAPPPEELAKPGSIWMLGRKPWRIDVLTQVDGVTFAQVWKGRTRMSFEGGRLGVIGLKELLANKRASARPKDLADVASLEALSARTRRRKRRRNTPRR